MPTARRTRTIAASAQELWEVVGDPHHLPRWWPRVNRVEAVTLTGTGEKGEFTEVLMSAKGKIVRADFELTEMVNGRRIAWAQLIQGTPFERVLKSAETQIDLDAVAGSHGPTTQVTIELRQELQGFHSNHGGLPWVSGISRLGGPLVRRAANATVQEALDGLEAIVGR